jgi:hypothetical protein
MSASDMPNQISVLYTGAGFSSEELLRHAALRSTSTNDGRQLKASMVAKRVKFAQVFEDCEVNLEKLPVTSCMYHGPQERLPELKPIVLRRCSRKGGVKLNGTDSKSF